MAGERYISVTALTRYLKRKLESDRHLQDVWLRGEISNFKRHSRGHMYLTIKDQGSRIQAVMFAGHNQRMDFTPENGMKVLVRGEISVYEPYGQYQLYIKDMQPDGIGNLYLAFEKLKKKLDQEGYFAKERKRPLPGIPYEIGIITSPTGAAIRDIFTTIKRRFPAARLSVFPVLVQGERAADSIAKAIKAANDLGFLDVLIVGRGGGSIEELWAFNEERVAHSIFHSAIPIVSAVGHETDFTIADFVADLRAATPTAAAELVVPHINELKNRVEDRMSRLVYTMNKRVEREAERLARLRRSYAFKYPAQLLRQKEQDLDRLFDQLTRNAKRQIKHYRDQSEQTTRILYKHHPEERIRQHKESADNMKNRLVRAMAFQSQRKQHDWKHLIGQLNALSPLSIMERGYSLAYTQEDILVKSVKTIQPGDPLKVKMSDGTLDCQVWGIEERDPND
ncbi:exodeoxyribonuclease VII large subunit [Scopulibacillus darangshiensis]|uniref:Exodeoxyribonuclease 7 large subunit n=1 Tax=Scopulibacillus darangshiensis TaxID=442528 RepID=A0A4V2SNH0_9BACL|nr:exodeoxyribonuclease VII large subunit [Scopulibacillus darangshiensis]TCP31186.1 exodeoxyribonuclease VII large subunit [Scopulibacillus darangshiensis]